MIVELHNEPGNFRLTYPKTELRTSPLEFPIVLTRTLVDKNGSLWNVEVSNVKLEGLHKKEILG